MGGLRGEEKWRPDRTSASEGWLRVGGFPIPAGTLGGSDQGGSMLSPAQLAGEVCLALGLGPTPSEAPLGPRGSWGHRREAREIRRGGWEGALWDGPAHLSPETC